MRGSGHLIAASLFVFSSPAAYSAVKAWQDAVTLPTFAEGLPDINSFMDSLPSDFPAVYPYTRRATFGEKASPQSWRRLNLENEYLLCTFLPDLGGRLYTCLDKLSGRPMFRANSSIKKAANVALRGAYVALGIEMNFPAAHTRETVSPVSFSIDQRKDRATVWLGSVDRVTGLQWTAEFVLREGSAVLQQNMTFVNPTAVRQPYLWWNNASIPLEPGSRYILPAKIVATHGATRLDAWPLSSSGVDMSLIANDEDELSYVAYRCREPFVAVYQGTSRTAVVHFADQTVVAGKKLWTPGTKGEEYYSKLLSNDGTGEVEMETGLFANQETYQFLPPHQSIHFTEYWMPGRELDGVSRANLHGLLFMGRRSERAKSELVAELNVTHNIPGARIRIFNHGATVFDETADLDPAHVFTRSVPYPAPLVKYRFELADRTGQVLLEHTEDEYAAASPSEVQMGAQPVRDWSIVKTENDYLERGDYNELNSHYRFAEYDYRTGLAEFPQSAPLKKALGRLLTVRNRFEEAAAVLSEASASLPQDAGLDYYLGIAEAGLENEDAARKSLTAAAADPRYALAATLEIVASQARAGHPDAALELGAQVLAKQPGLPEAAGRQVALLRKSGKTNEARAALQNVLSADPADLFLRLEQVKLGSADETLWNLLGANPERVLDVAGEYLRLGLFDEALGLLDHVYQPVPENQTEPGAVLPQEYPLVVYYRGYCRKKLGRSAAADFQAAASLPLQYVFPSRASSVAVLRAAEEENPRDASAHFLLGLLYLNENQLDQGITELEAARTLRKNIPGLYAVLGRALIEAGKDKSAGMEALREGLKLDPANQLIKSRLDAGLSASKASPSAPALPERPGVPAPASVSVAPSSPSEFANEALLMSASGDAPGASTIFNDAHFPQAKQEPAVRRAYIEVQLQLLLNRAAEHDCGKAISGVDTIGLVEDKSIGFTMYSFEALIKGARVQYYLGAVEAACGDPKAARKRWTRVSKMTAPPATADFAFPVLAAQTLSLPEAGAKITAARAVIERLLQSATPQMRGMLLYSQGVILVAAGQEDHAAATFEEGVRAPNQGMSQYLNSLALKAPVRAK